MPALPPEHQASSRLAGQHLLGVVLCGGRSSRMGRDKALLPHPRGGDFLSYAAGRSWQLCGHLILAGRPAPPPNLEIPANRSLATIPDPEQYRGPLSGLLAALDSAAQLTTPLPKTALLVTPLDMPLLTSDHLRLLVDCYDQAADPDTVVTASFDGRRSEPLVAIYPLSTTASLRRWERGASRSLSRWLEQHPHLVCQLPPAAAANVNTPQDAESLQP